MFLMTDRGTPFSYRYMHGFGSHNGGSAPNYFPNSFDNIVADPAYPVYRLNLIQMSVGDITGMLKVDSRFSFPHSANTTFVFPTLSLYPTPIFNARFSFW